MLEFFQYSFLVRGFTAGVIIAVIAPPIGLFLVLRRYALIADTLSHVSLAGVALGLIAGFNPILAAVGTTVVASIGIERLRQSRRISGESALALFLFGSLAVAITILSLARRLNANLFAYLFGSIVTVTPLDVAVALILGFIVLAVLLAFFKEILYSTFDEDAARVSGISTRRINTLVTVLAALTVSLAIPIVGILLISALLVIPVVTALQFKKDFQVTLVYAELFSILPVVGGLLASFYLNVPTGGTIVLLMLGLFLLIFIAQRGKWKANH